MLRTDLIAPVPVLLARHAAERGDKTSFADATQSLSYAELDRQTAYLAGHLADLGVAAGDAVALLLPNSVAWVVTCLAIVRAGAIAVPISYDATSPEILYRLTDAGCRAIVMTAERASVIEALRREAPSLQTQIFVGRGDGEPQGLSYSDLVGREPRSRARDSEAIHDPSFIVYTSGTTGRAKGVLLSVHGMLWVTAACWAPILQLSESDHVLSPLPLFHSYALNFSVLSILATGASEYIMEKYSTSEALKLLDSGKFTIFPGVPTMFHYLLQTVQERSEASFPGLRLCVSAGAIMPAVLNRQFESRLGVPLLDGYGITETSTMVTMNWPIGGRVAGSCGLPVPGLSVRIIDLNDHDVERGQEGELIVRGPNVMAGYHAKAEETQKALRGGWYRTGDLARSDENGFLTITGRLKELIIRGGQNIAPAEIEEVVSTCAGVLDCAVVGAPHELLGEVPALFVVADGKAPLDDEAILAQCRARLSAYKVPHSLHRVAEIPRTGSGKVLRFKLREMLQA